MIVVCGEALIDLFARASDGGLALEAAAGGSPFNVALGLARLGERTAYLGALSQDAFGTFLHARLEEGDVDLRLARRCPEPTALSVVSTGSDGQPAYAFYAGETADRALRLQDLPAALPDEARCLACGSYALGVEPIAGAIEALIAREAGRLVVSIDPNVRARVIGDLAAFRARFERLAAFATIVKASTEDLALLYGEAAEPESIARTWLARGTALAVVTRGAEGASALWADRWLDRPGRPVAVVDTVGAGDALHAALLAHLSRRGRLSRDAIRGLAEEEVAATLDAAIAAASIVCGRRGADLPRRAEVEALLGQEW